jgi:hypothetical protein
VSSTQCPCTAGYASFQPPEGGPSSPGAVGWPTIRVPAPKQMGPHTHDAAPPSTNVASTCPHLVQSCPRVSIPSPPPGA